jgi:hypothetical protein
MDSWIVCVVMRGELVKFPLADCSAAELLVEPAVEAAAAAAAAGDAVLVEKEIVGSGTAAAETAVVAVVAAALCSRVEKGLGQEAVT